MNNRLIDWISFLSGALVLITMCVGNSMAAQELLLFEETELSSRSSEAQSVTTTRRDRDGNMVTGPEFTLVGTSRLGDSVLAVVEDRQGEIISVRMGKDRPASITGHTGFEIVTVGSGEITVRYPSNVDCQEFTDRAVFCEDKNIARLGLANLVPLENTDGLTSANEVLDQEGPDSVINPFEALLQRAANSETTEDASSFQPVRIDPQDVPPGMRVVSTPFGDRLVEEE